MQAKIGPVGSFQYGSAITLLNVQKKVIIYGNEFRNILADTGTGFFIHQIDDPETHPIIVEKNTFEKNFAAKFGSAFAIMHYRNSMIEMDCKGIYVYNNTITQNTGCNSTVGAALISCNPEKFLWSELYWTEYTTGSTDFVYTFPSASNRVVNAEYTSRTAYADDISEFS